MQLPMIGTMEIDHGERNTSFFCSNVISINLLLVFFSVYENGNHSSYQDDDECDSSSHPRKIALDEDILPPPMPVDEDDDEPGMKRKERDRIQSIMSTS